MLFTTRDKGLNPIFLRDRNLKTAFIETKIFYFYNASADSPSTTKEACGVLRSLTLDDDVRVQFGKAHEHTKLIVTEHSGLERLFRFIEGNATEAILPAFA